MPKYQTYIDNGCEHKTAISNVIDDIRRQYRLWPTTVSTCITDGCENFAKGGVCADCLAKDLGEVTGKPESAAAFLSLTRAAHDAACLLIETPTRAEG